VQIGGRDETPEWQVVRGWRQRLSKLPEFDQERHTREAFRKILGAALPSTLGDKEVEAALADGLQALVSGWGERALE
jgi:hypothetical protein